MDLVQQDRRPRLILRKHARRTDEWIEHVVVVADYDVGFAGKRQRQFEGTHAMRQRNGQHVGAPGTAAGAQRRQRFRLAIVIAPRVLTTLGCTGRAGCQTHLLFRDDLHLTQPRARVRERCQRFQCAALSRAARRQIQHARRVPGRDGFQRRKHERQCFAESCRGFTQQ